MEKLSFSLKLVSGHFYGQFFIKTVRGPFCLYKYVRFNGQTFSSVFEQFSFTSKFLGLKMQKSTFFKKNGFESSFYKIDVKVVTKLSVRLEKHQTIEILLMVDFLRIFKMFHFSNFFEIFEIHQYFLVKLLNALNFNLNTVGQTQ